MPAVKCDNPISAAFTFATTGHPKLSTPTCPSYIITRGWVGGKMEYQGIYFILRHARVSGGATKAVLFTYGMHAALNMRVSRTASSCIISRVTLITLPFLPAANTHTNQPRLGPS